MRSYKLRRAEVLNFIENVISSAKLQTSRSIESIKSLLVLSDSLVKKRVHNSISNK